MGPGRAQGEDQARLRSGVAPGAGGLLRWCAALIVFPTLELELQGTLWQPRKPELFGLS